MKAEPTPKRSNWIGATALVLIFVVGGSLAYYQFVILAKAEERGIEIPPPKEIVRITIVLGAADPNNGQFFVPDTITVVLGFNHTVVWTNDDHGVPHTVTSEAGGGDFQKAAKANNFIEPGQSWNYTFTKAGNYKYFCTPHPWMRAKVIVLPLSQTGESATSAQTIPPSIPDVQAKAETAHHST